MSKTKLNIGCGWPEKMYQRPKWINLDLVHTGGEIIRANALALPFRDKQFDRVDLIHCLEHLPRNQSLSVLKEMCRVTRGHSFIEVPDLPIVVKQMNEAYESNDREKILDLMIAIYGKSDRPGMGHQIGFDEQSLRGLMLEAGFKTVTRETEMVSTHFKKVPVLLMKGTQ